MGAVLNTLQYVRWDSIIVFRMLWHLSQVPHCSLLLQTIQEFVFRFMKI